MSNMLAVITTGDRELPLSLGSHLAADTVLHVHYDWEKRGVAHARNECIKAFTESSHNTLFLMDDDVDLRLKGWEQMFTNEPSLLFAGYPNPKNEAPANSLGPLSFWHTITGACYYMPRKHVETVGYFNTKLGRYGWTDVGYMHRCRKAYAYATFPFPIRALVAISPRDIYGLHPQRSAVMSMQDKHDWIERNRSVHLEEVNGPVYLPYNQ